MTDRVVIPLTLPEHTGLALDVEAAASRVGALRDRIEDVCERLAAERGPVAPIIPARLGKSAEEAV